MLVGEVKVSSAAYMAMLTHALTSEKEEVMGLLLGDVEERSSGAIAIIWGVSVLSRSDKRKDRVEISPEQSSAATVQAEKMTEALGRRTRVVGWYHSHPHITVLPSHVDIATQYNYQQYMDPHFIGLIFSVFNNDSSMKGRIQVIAFQSIESTNSITASGSITGSPLPPGSPILVDDDISIPLSSSSRPTLERLEIPFSIIPQPFTPAPNNLESIVHLQTILQQEEQHSFLEANKSSPHPLSQLYNSGVYQKSMCRLLEYGCSPLLATMQDMLDSNNATLKKLQETKERLLLRSGESVKKEDKTRRTKS
eukprot:TRINITY_DN2498_c0_g1_i2.p1 TRINITY_DN2498_c0_g1~~TRINITY_DN2498_c0_g1_i2.p1  ORF type:complete len:309 (-),score=76.46 TRINITY_DN2498_c0_g1_i2:59-985(-)